MASPAEAAGRTLVQATSGWCLRDSGGGIANVDLKSCTSKPTVNNTWSFVSKGTNNNHPLRTFKNVKTGRCMANVPRVGAGSGPLMRACDARAGETWELFYIGSGSSRRMVLKNLGSWTQDRYHLCLRRLPGAGTVNNIYLATCNVKDTYQQFRP